MLKTYLELAAVIGATLAAACTDTTSPLADVGNAIDDYQLPPPDTSLDPDRLTVGDYLATPCDLTPTAGMSGDGFARLRERHEWALVDVFFGRASAEGPWDGPTTADIDLVKSHGGRVLYSFHVPAVRARLILSRIPGLVEEGFWVTVRDVSDATRYDVPLSVGFNRPLTDDDVDTFARLGGRVTYRFEFINALAGILPDRSIPAYQDRSDVDYVQASGVMCLASPAGP